MTTDLEQRLRDYGFLHNGVTFRHPMAQEAADELARLRAENERLREALGGIVQWADAYPHKVFGKPDLRAVQALLTDAGMRGQMDRMHASWARHLTEGIGNIARAALKGSRHE